uniref:RING-type domain-containing protein n=1 Tax=Hydatigena taeniaeformis TaxID=6205 RepID=A0A0R3XBG8_HYDTA
LDNVHLAKKSARLLAGLPVNGLRYPPNSAWVEWARANNCLPSEEEEEEGETELLEEAEMEASGNDKPDFKGDEEMDEFDETVASVNEKFAIANSHASLNTESDTVPSFAKVRHLFDPDETFSWISFGNFWTPLKIQSQRILVWDPINSSQVNNFTVFYYLEFLGTEHHARDLGSKYDNLFIGDVLRECQSHPQSRQTSSSCPWYATERFSKYSYDSYSSSMSLGNIFEVEETVMHDLTKDFCPWSALDGRGVNALFDGLFFEDNRTRGNFTCFLDEKGDGDSWSEGIGRLFDIRSLSCEEVVRGSEELSGTTYQRSFSSLVDNSLVESEVSLSEDQNVYAIETDNEGEVAPSSASSATYKSARMLYTSITECPYCRPEVWNSTRSIDVYIGPTWKWIPRLTRWPFRFAPQQNVDLSMNGIQIPPWRASSGRMMLDICRFCAKNQDISNLVLLDPMALSPLSPLLNLMRYHVVVGPQLTGVLWMTPLDALSPFYRVPIPPEEQQKDGGDGDCKGNPTYPTPICLRFLAITALLTNWVAWFSRIESYAVLGMSRLRSLPISIPIAVRMVQPLSLGCGQAPLLDLWPMWLLRRLFTLSLRLSQLRIPFLHCKRPSLRHFYPFSDLDEI